jgi:hypothetical protein
MTIHFHGPTLRRALVSISCVLLAGLSGCGNGCSSLQPTPGGFPSASRNQNGGQIRITDTGLAAISADPAALVGGLLGGMGLSIDVPANCGGNPAVCCPGGTAVSPCGPVTIDLMRRPGDLPRMELHPASGQSRLDVTIRARLKTVTDIPVKVPVVGDCGIAIDTSAGANADIKIDVPISFPQDAQAGTTRVVAGTVALTQLNNQDVKLTGGIGCQLASLGIGFFIGTISSTFESAIRDAINNQTCKACPSGTTAECGPFATSCKSNVCTKADNTCVQELGIAGRLSGASLLGNVSPGTQGAADIYDVAGGYATTESNGLALGLLSGTLPAGTPHDRCGPVATPPPAVAIPQSAFFQGNTRPDTGATFGLGFGYHKSQIDQLLYGMYDGGVLCLTVTTKTVPQLTTDTLSLLSRSLGDLTTQTGNVAIGLRPQAPPVTVLGRNIFVDMGGMKVLQEPLLDITFKGLELDFFAQIENQYVRVFTVVTDLHLPLGLQVGAMGDIVPVLGDLKGAFTNVTVKNSEALKETPASLAASLPAFLDLALPGLAGGLGSFQLPQLGGLAIKVKEITAVDNKQFLAIFADLAPATMAGPPVIASAQLGQVVMPSDVELGDPSRWSHDASPMIELALGVDTANNRSATEWSWRIDEGLWSPWSSANLQTVRSRALWLPGLHHIEVVARRDGDSATASSTPAVVEFTTETNDQHVRRAKAATDSAGFHGQGSGNGGCSCQTGGSTSSSDPWIIGIAFAAIGWRGRRRSMWRSIKPRSIQTASLIAIVAGAMFLSGCSCGSNPCGPVACEPGEIAPGEIGRHNSIASDGARTVVATYDQIYGDLVLVDLVNGQAQSFVAVDGIPADGVPIHDPSTYRRGIADTGEDVGWYTSVALVSSKARIAYYDRDNAALKFAIEEKSGKFRIMTVDDDASADVGAFASLVLDANGSPSIAYVATNLAGTGGERKTELRLARSSKATPNESDWTITVIASSVASCAGVCAAGQACVVSTATPTSQACAAITTDCAAACASGQSCVAGMCRQAFAAPPAPDLATGSGLFVNLLNLPGGRLAAVYYNRAKTSLVIAVESAAGSSQFTETVLDATGDRGMFASAVVDGGGVVHVAYQDALADTLFYTTWNNQPGTPALVDDGLRNNERPHPVGNSAKIVVRGGAPAILYQDGLTSDVMLAQPSGMTWSHAPFAAGAALDGFYIEAVDATAVWGTLDQNVQPIMNLTVKSL